MLLPWEIKKNREDVVQAALVVERWCNEHIDLYKVCDCPFALDEDSCFLSHNKCVPDDWGLEEHLRTRGLKDGSV